MYPCLCRLERQLFDRATQRRPTALLITSPKTSYTLSLNDPFWHSLTPAGCDSSQPWLTGVQRALQVAPSADGRLLCDQDFEASLDVNDMEGLLLAWQRQQASPKPDYVSDAELYANLQTRLAESVWRFQIQQWRHQAAIPGNAPFLPAPLAGAAL